MEEDDFREIELLSNCLLLNLGEDSGVWKMYNGHWIAGITGSREDICEGVNNYSSR